MFGGAAADTLEKIGPAGEQAFIAAMPAFVAHLMDPDDRVRLHAIKVLPTMGPTVWPALATALKNRDDNFRQLPPEMLEKIGSGASALVAASVEPDEDVRQHAALTYKNIVTDAVAVPPLLSGVPDDILFVVLLGFVAALKHPHGDFRQAAADALTEIGPTVVPALVAALENPDEDFRRRINDVLKKIEPSGF